jgi:hypothetical protein
MRSTLSTRALTNAWLVEGDRRVMGDDANQEHRQHLRAPTAARAVVLARHNAGVALTIVSISLGGARLEGEISVVVGERVQILFEIDAQPIDVGGEVVRVEMIDMAMDHIAVRFLDLPPEAKRLIHRMVERALDV